MINEITEYESLLREIIDVASRIGVNEKLRPLDVFFLNRNYFNLICKQ